MGLKGSPSALGPSASPLIFLVILGRVNPYSPYPRGLWWCGGGYYQGLWFAFLSWYPGPIWGKSPKLRF